MQEAMYHNNSISLLSLQQSSITKQKYHKVVSVLLQKSYTEPGGIEEQTLILLLSAAPQTLSDSDKCHISKCSAPVFHKLKKVNKHLANSLLFWPSGTRWTKLTTKVCIKCTCHVCIWYAVCIPIPLSPPPVFRPARILRGDFTGCFYCVVPGNNC